MSINELQDEVIAEFSDFDDWMDHYQLLIDLGNEQEPLDEKYKTEQNLIEGSSRSGLAEEMRYYGFNNAQIEKALKEVGY